MQFTTLAVTLFAAASAVVAAPLERRDGGQATYFYQGGNPGACGNYHSDDDRIVAVNSAQYNQGLCGKSIWINHNGNTVEAKVADECPTCAWGDLDLSVGAFKALANMDQGQVPISWNM
ncbi:uncharacterized protein PFL1_06584 [Pseudozyma flocculosa PF-1]|uniref:Related to rasp f 7 allergen n=2 Tax=Pseudozyma flocculosa TaxID=84751 RepID=A0A5C3F7Y1_9BASI|nr:uncharacterized protein PFL1_06584 [Pseudozyma flocculosa PF-1]EPQ25911.1 hypothetical protein PFL1_06584 [Pseudozyma flocculosa PF-1]SPO40588.1 related to rasp f 7 allergen [Pseudozyma flocculosa]